MTETQNITVGELQIEWIKKPIKNIHLTVHPPDGRVRLAAPTEVNDEAVRLFVISKLGWIKRQQRRFEQQDRQLEREMLERESHFFRGHRYLLRVQEINAPPRVEVASKTHLDLFVRPATTAERRLEILREWYRKELREQAAPLLEKWQERMGVRLETWQIKRMRTKWGVCNIEKRRVWLNLELAKKPESCLEYVIVHELAHLLERHHNDRFRAILNQYLPDWQARRDLLNAFVV